MKNITWLCIIAAFLTSYCSKKASGGPVTPPPVNEPPIEVKDCKKCILLAEQSEQRIVIVDAVAKKMIWEWTADQSNVKSEHYKWFTNPSDAKPVYAGKYILMTASGGAVALIRIADKKTVFYAYAGGNTHSAELLPDGNIVSASSTGNYLTVFKMDSTVAPENVYKKNIPIEFGHNVVWDAKRQVLWSAAMDQMKIFSYNFDCAMPGLTPVDSLYLPGTEAHDLYPVYGADSLWLTNKTNVYRFSAATKKWVQTGSTLQKSIKSVSSGPSDFPVLIIKPKQSWWTDEVLDVNGKSIFWQSGLKIYKARWLLTDTFSYPAGQSIQQCQ